MAMQMDGMVGHGEVAHANAHLVAVAHVERIDTGEHPAVPRPQVEVQHGHGFWRHAAGVNVIGIQQKYKVTVHLADQRRFYFGVCYPETHHAHGHLRHFIRMRVVHEGTRPASHKLIDECFANTN